MRMDPILTLKEFPAYLQGQRTLPRYDAKQEKKPDDPWWRLDRASIDELMKELAQLITEQLKGSPDNDKELQHLLRTATDLAHVVLSPAIKVALIGAQGAGKSLTINALFDCDGLSLTGAEGAVCTSSITRYVQYPKSTTGEDQFFAEIKFFTREEREALLKEHARSYYVYHNVDDDDDDDEDVSRTKTIGQDEMDRSLNDTAEDIFTTLFGFYDEFLENWNVSDYRSGEFINLCQLKCDEALKKEQVDSQGIATKMADTQKELLEKLRPFLTSVKGQRCLWPLVDHIAIRFHHELLQGGIEIIDLPGWGDINLSRVRHAEQIKDTVDVEIILADTIRIASDDKVINSTRAAVAHHGPSKVKVVATKVDSLSKNQLSQCAGGEFNIINQLLQEVEEQEAGLDDDDEDEEVNSKERRTLGQYRIYLERIRKQKKILQRADIINAELTAKLKGRTTKDMPQIFHTSASEYMDWIRKPKLGFSNQPSLSPDMTGIPSIREYLFSLPAQQNLRDYERHINTTIPAFIEKVKRTVSERERDGDFRTIADDIDAVRRGYMTRLLSEAKKGFQGCFDESIQRIEKDIPNFKEQLEEKMTTEWFILRSAAFTRILRHRGIVLKGASKAKGLENGCHWNKELADLLAPGFNKWYNAHTGCMRNMKPALGGSLDQLHHKITNMIHDSGANMVTIEKARKRWAPLRNKLQAKLMVMMEEVSKLEKLMFESATMEFGQERNLISYMTDDLYTEVFEAVPEEKPPLPAKSGKKKPAKRYVMPKLKFQKKRMEDLFLNPDTHFIDQVFLRFQAGFNDAVRTLLDKHFVGIDKMLENLSTSLRAEAPIDYRITEEGKAIRADLAEQILSFEEKAMELRNKLPQTVKSEDDTALIPPNNPETSEGDENDNLAIFYDKMTKSKRRVTPDPAARRTKRIKTEPS